MFKTVFVTMISLFTLACGSSNSDPTQPPHRPNTDREDAELPSPPEDKAPAQRLPNLIGSEGGRWEIAAGAALSIPEGALESPVFFSAEETPGAIVYDSPNQRLELGGWKNLGPNGTVFDPPATLTLSYGDHQELLGEWETRLEMVRISNGIIETLDSTVHAESARVSAPTDHFSRFGLGIGLAKFTCDDQDRLGMLCDNGVGWSCALSDAIDQRDACGEDADELCGDGVLDEGEVCESGGQQACVDSEGYAGHQTCEADCSGWDDCVADQSCGDGEINGPEICETADAQACEDESGYPGTQSCEADCSGWDDCMPEGSCGDGTVNGSEVCEPDGRETCLTNVGYAGERACLADCEGWGACLSDERCGDGIVNGPEVCEPNTQQPCVDANGYQGSATCSTDCAEWGACRVTEFCGDGIVNGGEECDDGNRTDNDGCTDLCLQETSTCLMHEVGGLGGSIQDIAIQGSIAYVSRSRYLEIFDISNPNSYFPIARYDLGHVHQSVAVKDDVAHLISGERLTTIDVSNPTSPSQLGQCDANACTGRDIALQGNTAYLASRSKGLVTVDVSNPDSPYVLSQFKTTPDCRARSVAVVGDIAYLVGERNGLFIIDVSNPYQPNQTGSYVTTGNNYDLVVDDDIAYIADWDNGLIMIDVGNPASPNMLGSYPTSGRAVGVEVYGQTAVVVDQGDLLILDVADPTSPQQLGDFNANGLYYAFGVALSGHTAFLYATNLTSVDISNSSAPSLMGNYGSFSSATQVAVASEAAIVYWRNKGYAKIDISDNHLPTWFGFESQRNLPIYHIQSNGETALVSSNEDLKKTGVYALVPHGFAGLYIYDISNLTSPLQIGGYNSNGWSSGVALSGDIAYLADGDNGLLILDIANPSSPIYMGKYETEGDANDVEVINDIAFVATSQALISLDLSIPDSPTLVSSLTMAGAKKLDMAESVVYVAFSYSFGSGLKAVDVSNPARLELLDSITTAGQTRNVAVAGGAAYLADYQHGMVIIEGLPHSCSTTCGNGAIEPPEACDDGSNNGLDGHCSTTCKSVQTCGDGVRQGTEFCDDGPGKTCLDDCTDRNWCGNGLVFGAETCDDGASNGTGSGFCKIDCSGVEP